MNEKAKNRTKKETTGKKKLLFLVTAIIITAILIVGLTYAWFYNHTDMATLMKISPPSDIAILGPGGKEMTSLDLNYTSADKDENNKVTIRRVICVQSGVDVKNYKLEIVHTTNLKGLTFNLYPVTEVTDAAGNVTDDGHTYNYDGPDRIAIEGQYLNLNNGEAPSNYKYATNDRHSQNYNDYSNVQSHAEPLYWLVNASLQPKTNEQVTIENKKYNRTYYVCEVTWTETTKETDIFYILAQTA